jgi:hypothetical protein
LSGFSQSVPLQQSFDPIREALTGRDLIPEMVNGQDNRRKLSLD